MAEVSDTKYCIDSSSLIELRSLEADVFPGIWDVLSDAVDSGILHAPHEVFRELDRVDDVTARWAKSKKSMFFNPDQTQLDKLIEVQDQFRFYDPESDDPKADPFLVAHAVITGCTVVTQEVSGQGKKGKAKIPDACDHFGVKYITLSEFFREQGWTFVGSRQPAKASTA